MKDPVVISVHGFNVTDHGLTTTDRLRPYYEKIGYEFVKVDYDQCYGCIRDFITTFFTNSTVATRIQKLLKKYHQDGRIVILEGHSNAAAIFFDVCQTKNPLLRPDIIVLTNPALEPTLTFGKAGNFPPVFVLIHHAPSDTITALAENLSKWTLPYFKKLRPWGNMGQIGCTAKDSRVTNINIDKLYKNTTGLYAELGHSGYYGTRLPTLAPIRIATVQQAVAQLQKGL